MLSEGMFFGELTGFGLLGGCTRSGIMCIDIGFTLISTNTHPLIMHELVVVGSLGLFLSPRLLFRGINCGEGLCAGCQ